MGKPEKDLVFLVTKLGGVLLLDNDVYLFG